MRQIATPPLMRSLEEGSQRGPIPHHKGRRLKRYEVFPGRNKFYCDGRIIMAKQTHVFMFTCSLIIGTCTLFFVFDCPYLFDHLGRWIPGVAGLLLSFVMLSLLRTSFSDPGIIPRATPEEAAYIEKQHEVPNGPNPPPLRPPPRTKEVIIHGQTVKLKYCFTCKIFRPPRASHCSLCDNCVDRFDHHCPWVGNCVGRRNYRYFYMFIISLAALCIFIFSCVVTRLIFEARRTESFQETLRENPASCVELVICFFSIWSILGLAGFHTYLTTANQTTNEDIKGIFSSRRGQEVRNPYSLGSCWANCGAVLCAPIPPSLIDRRSYVDSGTKITAIRPFSTVSSSKNGSQHSLAGQQVVAGGIPLNQLDRVERMVGGEGRGVNGASQGSSHRAISAPPATWNPHIQQPRLQFNVHPDNRAGTLPQNLQGRNIGHNPVPVAVVPPHRAHGGHNYTGGGFYRATPHIENGPMAQQKPQNRVLSPTDYPASILKQSSV